MTINVSVHYNGGLLPDIDPRLLPSDNPFKCHTTVIRFDGTIIIVYYC